MSTRLKMESVIGRTTHDVLTDAVAQARTFMAPVYFEFNGHEFTAQPEESFEEAKSRFTAETGLAVKTREEIAKEAGESLRTMEAEQAEAIAASKVPTEQEMRDTKVPWLRSEEELVEYIRTLVDRPHDYGTCVYAMSMAAEAAFNYVSGKLGVTGFQASCADMDFLRRTRGLAYKYGFRIINYGDMLYPQYWDEERTPMFEAILKDPETRKQIASAAREFLLSEESGGERVREHWQWLASLENEA